MRDVSDEEIHRLVNKFLAEFKAKHPRVYFSTKNMDWLWSDFKDLLLRFAPAEIEEIIEFAFNHREYSIPPLTGSRDFFFRWNEFVTWYDRVEKVKKERHEMAAKAAKVLEETKEYVEDLKEVEAIPMPDEIKATLKRSGLL